MSQTSQHKTKSQNTDLNIKILKSNQINLTQSSEFSSSISLPYVEETVNNFTKFSNDLRSLESNLL